ncbi:uncharacterized protein [Ptychodera flava]|uniref:uncharacterized protein n=1 Tax=Ptychodera flava TaxID=63121 RepID=UPI00396A2509
MDSERRAGTAKCQVCRTSLLLFTLIALYLAFGASVFWHLESETATNGAKSQNFGVDVDAIIQKLGRALRPSVSNWTELAREILIEHECFEEHDPTSPMEFRLAIELCLSIMTTIGYGNVTPKTQHGRLFCCFYAMFGIPLFLIVISHFGNIVARKLQTAERALIAGARQCANKWRQGRWRRRKAAKLDLTADRGIWEENWYFKNSRSSINAVVKEGKESNEGIDNITEWDAESPYCLNPQGKDIAVVYNTISKRIRMRAIKEQVTSPVYEIATWWSDYTVPVESICETAINNTANGQMHMKESDDNGPILPSDCQSDQPLHGTGSRSQYPGDSNVTLSVTEPHEFQIKRDIHDGAPWVNASSSEYPRDNQLSFLRRDQGTQASASDENDRHLICVMIFVMIVFMAIWVTSLSYFKQHWTIIDSIYFCTVSITTIGFGDLQVYVSDDGSRVADTAKAMVSSVFILAGLIMLSACFNIAQVKIKYVAYKLFNAILSLCQCNICKGCTVHLES